LQSGLVSKIVFFGGIGDRYFENSIPCFLEDLSPEKLIEIAKNEMELLDRYSIVDTHENEYQFLEKLSLLLEDYKEGFQIIFYGLRNR